MKYHLSKVNLVADNLSRASMGSMSHTKDDGNRELAKNVHSFVMLGVKLNAS